MLDIPRYKMRFGCFAMRKRNGIKDNVLWIGHGFCNSFQSIFHNTQGFYLGYGF